MTLELISHMFPQESNLYVEELSLDDLVNRIYFFKYLVTVAMSFTTEAVEWLLVKIPL